MVKKIRMGRIVKTTTNENGFSFKSVFKTKKDANQYKDMMRIIFESDNYKVEYEKGAFDNDLLWIY